MTMYVGSCYYPEQWPEAEWARDADLMLEAGFNCVRLGDMTWSGVEPQPGRYALEWLTRAIDTFAARSLRIILATPTATLPPWLLEEDPEVLPVDAYGVRAGYGSWGSACLSSSAYMTRSYLLVERLASRFGQHPSVVAWQVDNELMANHCWCARCGRNFQHWLEKQYGTVQALNDAWGTAYFGTQYNRFSEISPPRAVRVFRNGPSVMLDYSRFQSDLHVEHVRKQAAAIRERSPARVLTHNIPGRGAPGPIDLGDLFECLDVAAFDNYPGWTARPAESPAFTCDLVRGIKGGPYLVLEQQAGRLDRPIITLHHRGQLRLWAHQTVARGATGVVFFQWRTARMGSEQLIGSMLHPDGRKASPWEELAQFAREVHSIAPQLSTSAVRPDIAFLYTYESLWALDVGPASAIQSHWHHHEEWYHELYVRNVPCDILALRTEAPLERYRLICVPSLLVVEEHQGNRLAEYVRSGGVLVIGARTGSKTKENLLPRMPIPGLLAELAGVEVNEFGALPLGETVIVVDLQSDRRLECRTWIESLAPSTAQTVLSYLDGPLSGSPAVTARLHGLGVVYYVGCCGPEVTAWVLEHAMRRAKISPSTDMPDGVEVIVRRGSETQLVFVLNHLDTVASIKLPYRNCRDAASKAAVCNELELEPYAVRILEADVNESAQHASRTDK